jgi:hypothetical protein
MFIVAGTQTGELREEFNLLASRPHISLLKE